MAGIELKGLVKRYGQQTVLHGLDLDISDGEFIALVGPSGCGKSTTLRMIAGLEDITAGELRIGDRTVNDLEPKDRDIAMVFQNYAIYPHMTVSQNIGFGLYSSKLGKAEKQERILAAARMLGLEPLLQRRPSQLSGGQRQRVAIGRAMVRNPAVFLFDEPLSNLDAQLRGQMRIEIKRLHRQLGTTVVYVTHDQIEAMTMADRIVVMRDGHLLQVGSPMSLYEHPADVFTARFIGTPTINVMKGVLTKDATSSSVEIGSSGVFDLGDAFAGKNSTLPIQIGMRPQHLRVTDRAETGSIVLSGTVVEVEPLGSETLVHVKIVEDVLIASLAGGRLPEIGKTVTLAIDSSDLYVFDAATEKAVRRTTA